MCSTIVELTFAVTQVIKFTILIVWNPLDLEGTTGDMPASTRPPFAAWLIEWEAHLMDSSLVPQVPESACMPCSYSPHAYILERSPGLLP